jgi:hypothetical protein
LAAHKVLALVVWIRILTEEPNNSMTDEEKLELIKELRQDILKRKVSLRALKLRLYALERIERTDRSKRPALTFREGFVSKRIYEIY